MSTMKKLVMTGAAVLATAGIGLGAAQLASADTTTTPEPSVSGTTESSAPGKPQVKGGDRQGHPGGHRGGLDTKALAEKLGVEEQAVQEALESLRPTKQDKSEQGTPPQQEDRSTRETALAKGLAEKLGLDEATVSSALSELRAAADADRAARVKQTLDEAVTGGTLTQAEADAVAKAAEAGLVEVRGGGRR
ncbi:hypothetical protein EII34_14120 [Arachnia propionica]|uniref:Uncharacterized protein n=1 Tax=Arachnia propionica TaxID=1750 RepID=A0A3P1T1V1_9ACTN|nr:hypothetical protein [Arachnia propionica]MDO5084067.1 hypothetical protein [Arachnia propionica]RRD03421.1 hypothetical protein EII34_14120 [Arachnia propionica]